MNNIKAKDLIQAKALGCLDPDDDAIINKLMVNPKLPGKPISFFADPL